MTVKTFIWVTIEKEGFHNWPNAPAEQMFLRNLHRHIFRMKIWIEVFHTDREIEFFTFKNKCQKFIDEIFNDLPAEKSCEMISDALYQKISNVYPGRKIRIEISEDGENGSYKFYE